MQVGGTTMHWTVPHSWALQSCPLFPLRDDMSAINVKGSLAVIWEAEQPAQGMKKGEEACHGLCQERKDDDSLGHVQNE